VRKSALERFREAKSATTGEQQQLDYDGLFALLLGGEINPTQKAFAYSPERLKAYMGPAGCAKTSTLCASGLMRALLQPGSKGLVARADYNDLMDTTALRLEEMVNRLPRGVLLDRDKSPPMKWWIRPAVEGGDVSQVTFMGLKDMLGSYEFNWAIVDEAAEVEEARIHEINTRLRHKGGDYSVGLAFNPPDKHHWLYTACTGRDFQDKVTGDAWLKLFLPSPRENITNLPPDYYENLAKSLPPDMRQRLIEGVWGSTFEGQPVYREFRSGIHIRDTAKWYVGDTLLRFWDFGYQRPACIWAKVDTFGRLIIFKEHLGESTEATAFAKRCIALTQQSFPGAEQTIDFGDPAVVQKKDTGQTLAEFYKAGILIRYKKTQIDTGVRRLRQLMEQLVEGEPAFQVSASCHVLTSALRGGYHMDKDGQKPFKDGYYDHLCDALRYGVDNVYGGMAPQRFDHLPQNLEYDSSFDHEVSQ